MEGGPVRCEACGKQAEGVCVLVRGKTYHIPCLACDSCHAKLDGTRLFFQGKSKLCEKCNAQAEAVQVPSCARCREKICDGATYRLTPKNLAYHQQCFMCSDCSGPLPGCYFTKGDVLYCKRCTDRRRAAAKPKTCGVCAAAIRRGERFVATERGATFHKACFVCKACSSSISGEYYATLDGPMCKACAPASGRPASGQRAAEAAPQTVTDGHHDESSAAGEAEDFKDECAAMSKARSMGPAMSSRYHTGGATKKGHGDIGGKHSDCARCKTGLGGCDFLTVGADAFHRACFVCDLCSEQLPGTYYPHAVGRLCQRCAEAEDMKTARQCHECRELIGPGAPYFVTEGDEHYHERCFACSRCRCLLKDGRCHEDAGAHCCGKCYDKEHPAKKCEGCARAIAAGDLFVVTDDDHHYHKACFACCGCEEQLSGTYYRRPEGIYCKPCVEKRRGADTRRMTRGLTRTHLNSDDVRDGPAGGKEAQRCGECKEELKSGEACMTTPDGASYHKRCFCCYTCKEQLGSYYSMDGHRFCKACAEKKDDESARECAECHKKVRRGEQALTTANGDTFHAACFVCHGCRGALQEYFTRPEGRYCKTCVQAGKDKLSGGDSAQKVCAACHQTISSREAFMALADGFYHRRCWVCSSCGGLLQSSFFEGRRCQQCFVKANVQRPNLKSVATKDRGAAAAGGAAADEPAGGPPRPASQRAAPGDAATSSRTPPGDAGRGGTADPGPRPGAAAGGAAPHGPPGAPEGSGVPPSPRGGVQPKVPSGAGLECVGCKAVLGEIYFTRPDGKYCRACVERQKDARSKQPLPGQQGLVCAQCHKKVSEDERYMKTVDGLVLHKQCFRCCKCAGPLPPQFFIGPEGRYCRKCMQVEEEAIAKTCGRCSQKILGGGRFVTTSHDETFHERCFLCTSCRTPVGGSYFTRSDGPLCKPCHDRAIAPKYCRGCKHQIAQSDSFVLNVHGDVFHEECFKCRGCRQHIMGLFHPKFDSGTCNACQERGAVMKVCQKCSRSVGADEPQVVASSGHALHQACSICQLCDAPIGGSRSALITPRHLFAGGAYGITPTVKCRECDRVIPSGEEYLHALDDHDYHLSCFTCACCEDSLVGPYHERSSGRACRSCVQREDNSSCCARCRRQAGKSTSKHVCEGCKLALDGVMTKVDGKCYHEDCFVCSRCHRKLAGNFCTKAGLNFCKACAD